MLGNLATVSSGFLITGVRRLALAWSVRDRAQLEEVRLAVPVPLRVVRLEVFPRHSSSSACPPTRQMSGGVMT